MELQSDMEIKEACGVFGIFNPNGEDAASSIYYGRCFHTGKGNVKTESRKEIFL